MRNYNALYTTYSLSDLDYKNARFFTNKKCLYTYSFIISILQYYAPIGFNFTPMLRERTRENRLKWFARVDRRRIRVEKNRPERVGRQRRNEWKLLGKLGRSMWIRVADYTCVG